MRSVSVVTCIAASFVLVIALSPCAAYADGLIDPPQVKISPPGGLASPTDEAAPPEPEVKISPPGGVASSAKIKPPGGRPTPAPDRSLFELFWMWLQTQAKIAPPGG